jgi:hypothetical protein
MTAEEDDYGLGLCLPCVLAHGRKNPHYAVTSAPMPYAVPAPDGTLAGIAGVPVPVCFDHVPRGGAAPNRPPGPRLVVAKGSVP